MLVNKSANTDPQQQEAASPQLLWSGCLQRWASRPTERAVNGGGSKRRGF